MADTRQPRKDGRTQTRTRYPGIFKVTYESGRIRYRVYVSVRGLGQKSKVYRTLDEARAWQGRLRDPREQKAFRDRQKARLTVAEAVRDFIDKNHRLKPSTRLSYESVLSRYLTPNPDRMYRSCAPRCSPHAAREHLNLHPLLHWRSAVEDPLAGST